MPRWSALLLALTITAPLWAHGSNRYQDTPVIAYRHSIVGAEAFYTELTNHAAGLLTAKQTRLLDQAREYYKYRDLEQQHSDPCAARNRQTQAELTLVDLAQSLSCLSIPAQHQSNPVTLHGQYPSILISINTGAEKITFRREQIDLRTVVEPQPIRLTVAPDATSYILLHLNGIPTGLSKYSAAITVAGEDKPSYLPTLQLVRPDLGQLRLTILDENSSETPAFVRLTALPSQKVTLPANALSYADPMLDIAPTMLHGTTGKSLHLYTLNDFEGPYAVCPGPFEMALPTGRWQIDIYKGIEYKSLSSTFTIDPDHWTEKQFQLKRWINMADRRWISGDDHVHARLMHSDDAEKLLTLSQAADLHIMNILEMGNHRRTWYAQRGFGPDFRVQRDDHILVPGQEDPRSMFGHAIGMNITALARDLDKYLLNDWVADEIHRQGGLYGHTHVGEKAFDVYRDMTMLIPRGKSDFNSIMQITLGTEYYYDFLNLGYRLTASAGSDMPYGGVIGLVRLYAYCPDDGNLADQWFAAVKAGHTFVTNGPMLELTVNGCIPGDTIQLTNNQKLKITARAIGEKHNSAPKTLELIRCGQVIATARSDDPAQDSLEIKTELEPAFGGWVAVRAISHNRAQAHTTPVYVQRPGLRPWHYESAPDLIRKRLATLQEIDQLTLDAQNRFQQGAIAPTDHWNLLLVHQGDEIRRRTQIVREHLNDLKKQHAAEKPLRAVR